MGHLSGARVSTIYINTHNYSENMYALIDNLYSALRCHAEEQMNNIRFFYYTNHCIYIYVNKYYLSCAAMCQNIELSIL